MVAYARAMAASVSPVRTVCIVPAPGVAAGAAVGTSDANGLGVAEGESVGVPLGSGGDADGMAPDGLGDVAGPPQAAITRHRATSGPGPMRRIGQFG